MNYAMLNDKKTLCEVSTLIIETIRPSLSYLESHLTRENTEEKLLKAVETLEEGLYRLEDYINFTSLYIRERTGEITEEDMECVIAGTEGDIEKRRSFHRRDRRQRLIEKEDFPFT